jgi:zinc protease
MKNKLICLKISVAAVLFLLGGAGLFGLAQPESQAAESGMTGGGEVITAYLDNGIPIFIQKNSNSRVMSLKLFFKGQAQFTPAGKEGIEKLTLNLLAHGSQNYSWDQVQTLLYQKSSSVGAFADYFDYSGFSMNTLDKYYSDIYALFADEILRPSWSPEEFEKVKNSLLMARTQKESDPYSLASQVLSDTFFGSHPYQADIDGTIESLKGITLGEVKEYYSRSLIPDRAFFVAVGDFDIPTLLEELNRDFGSLERRGFDFDPVDVLPPLDKSGLLKEVFHDSPGLAYVRGNFVLPELSQEEKAAFDLGLALLDDILFQVVRTENSACYSVWANLYDFQAKYGCFGVFKTQVPYEVDELIMDAVDILASGRCMSTAPSGDDPYVPIEEALDFYKAQFLTEYYIDQQTGSSIANQIGLSYLYEGNPAAYQNASEYWNEVTARDIVEVINRYLVDVPILWIVLGGEDILYER